MDLLKINATKKAISILPKDVKKKFIFAILIQTSLNFLDLIGLAMMAGIATITVHSLSSTGPNKMATVMLEILRIQNKSTGQQIATLAFVATSLFIIKTIFSLYLIKRNLQFLSRKGAELTEFLVRKLFNLHNNQIEALNSQEILQGIVSGANSVTTGIIGTSIAVLADSTLTLILIVGVLAIDPTIGFLSATMFSSVAYALHVFMKSRAIELGEQNTILTVKINRILLEAIHSYREVFVRNRRSFYVNEIAKSRREQSNVIAAQSLLPNVSKYVMDVSLFLGAFVVGIVEFKINSPSHAIGSLTLFLTAGARVAPAVLRIQQSLMIISSHEGASVYAYSFIKKVENIETYNENPAHFEFERQNLEPRVTLQGVDFRYPGAKHLALDQINLDIHPGQFVAVCGNSGAGKSTLADAILGLIKPQAGSVQISGLAPSDALSVWPGALAYVPQEIYISDGTVRENVAMAFDKDEIDDQQIWKCLKLANLDIYVDSLPQKLDTHVLERGKALSGGQRQRLGIARALYTNPQIIILDEATSSLDSISEMEITNTINQLKGSVTFIVIAHRLASIRTADKVIFLQNGKIDAIGTFEQLLSRSNSFRTQAESLGLN